MNVVQSCRKLDRILFNVLYTYAPLKCKFLIAKDSAYISIRLRKAIMRRSYREKVYCKSKSEKIRNVSPIILIRLLSLITSYCRKLLNHSFQTRETTNHKLNLFKKINYCKMMIKLQIN